MRLPAIILAFLRQRLLSSLLTALSVSAGVALASFLMILSIESERTFSQKDTGYEIIVGAKGSPLQLVLNTMYHIGTPTGNISLDIWERLQKDRRVKAQLPMVFGDNVSGYKVIGTIPDFFTTFQYRKNRTLALQQGRGFIQDYEAVLGAISAQALRIKVGDSITVQHGLSTEDAGAHDHGKMIIVGIITPTNTAIDRGVFMTMRTVWDVHYHEYQEQQEAAERALHSAEQSNISSHADSTKSTAISSDHNQHVHHDKHAHSEHTDNPTHDIPKDIPKDFTTITAIAVKLGSPVFFESFVRTINENTSAQAALPVSEMMGLFKIVGNINGALIAVSGLAIIIGTISIMTALYNSLNERKREIAIMRSLGARRSTIIMLILSEAGSIGFAGSVLGVCSAQSCALLLRATLENILGAPLEIQAWYAEIWLLAGGTILLTLVIACVPAWQAYRTSVSEHLAF
jgi:putative ABC transport system permease protein